MPYLILIFGALATLYVAYRFFMKATANEVKQAFTLIITSAFAGILLYFAISGRIAISIGLLILSVPIIVTRLKHKSQNKKDEGVIDVDYTEINNEDEKDTPDDKP